MAPGWGPTESLGRGLNRMLAPELGRLKLFQPPSNPGTAIDQPCAVNAAIVVSC